MSVVLVTGGSRGIGAQICKQAATEGWSVAVNYAHSADAAEAVVSTILQSGGRASAFQGDVSDQQQIINMFNQIDDELGCVTALVNNAGTNGGTGPVDELDLAATRRLFEVNTLGAFICASEALKRMSTKYGGPGGTIVNIGSAASKHGGPGSYIDYAASKGALDVFTIGLAREQAEFGVRVNCLRPGATMTEMSVDWAEQHPEWLDWVMKQVPLKRPAEMQEIANAALFLLSEKSSYMTGAIIDASGGWVSP